MPQLQTSYRPALTHDAFRLGRLLQAAFSWQALEVAHRLSANALRDDDADIPGMEHWVEHLAETLTPLMRQMFHRGIVQSRRRLAALQGGAAGAALHRMPQQIAPQVWHALGAKRKQLGASFDLFDPRVLRAVDRLTLQFCEETNATAVDTLDESIRKLRELLKQGLEEGKAVAQLAREVKRIFADPSRAFRIAATECLTGDSLICAANIKGIYRRYYRGTLVEAVVEGGQKITGTRNHPVLTRRGWVPLGRLQEDDDLVCNCFDVNWSDSAVPLKYDQAPPATISEIFDSLAIISVMERIPVAPHDFHGDGADGYVDVLTSGSLLRYGHLPTPAQLTKQLSFVCPDLLRSVLLDGQGGLFGFAPMVDPAVDFSCRPFGNAGILENSLDLSFVHGKSPESLGDLFLADSGLVKMNDFGCDLFGDRNVIDADLAGASFAVALGCCFDGQACSHASSSYSRRVATESPCQAGNRRAGLVEPDNFGFLGFVKDRLESSAEPKLVGFVPAAEFDPNGFASVLNNSAVSAKQASYCRETHATRIEFRRLLFLRFIENWHGYVFNLETTDGYYNTNGIVTKNSNRAIHAGALFNAQESSLKLRKEWLASSDACDACLELDGVQKELDEPFVVDGTGPYAQILHPPRHPHCFCSMGEVLA